jgi:hypothetical protein
MWPFPIPVWLYVAISIPVTIGLGIWGFLELPVQPKYSVWEAIYHAIKLYALDLGPAAGGSQRPQPNWQMWVALVLAALLVLRGLIALLRSQLQRWGTRYVVRRHVIVCGAGVHGTQLATTLSPKHDVVLIDSDPSAIGMLAPYGRYEWRAVGDGARDETLIAAGLRRAHWVVAMTGNDFVNSQIVSAVQGLAERGRMRNGAQVLVQLEDPTLARFLEEGAGEVKDGRATPTPKGTAERLRTPSDILVNSFSPNAIAADALLDTEIVDTRGRPTRLLAMRERDGGLHVAPNLLLAGDHPLIDALILAALRRWRVRFLRERESGVKRRRPPVHISVFGPDAVDRVERLRRDWRPEPTVLRLEAMDSGPIGDAIGEAEDWLHKPARADHVIVVCLEELDAIGLTLELGRELGGDMHMTRVSTELASVLDRRLEHRTAASDELATTHVRPISELASELETMGRLSGVMRLTDALKSEGGADEQAAQQRAEALYEHREQLGLRSEVNWRMRDCERPLLEALLKAQVKSPADAVPLSALVRAGLRVELADAENLAAAARVLSAEDSPDAFAAWCEFARRAELDSLPERKSSKPPKDPAEILLSLRRASLGDKKAIKHLETGDSPLKGAKRVAIFAGAAGTMSEDEMKDLRKLLERALERYDGIVLSGGTAAGVPGVLGAVTKELGLCCIGYAPGALADRDLYRHIRATPKATDFSVREPLAMWTDILRAGIAPKDVRVVALPGHKITIEEIMIARALGAEVAWLDLEGTAEPLDRVLPTGADDVLEIPVDAMTVRAFLSWSEFPELRDAIAEFIHEDYRTKHHSRKAPGDPALAPWSELIDELRASNVAQADDIQNKLALIGKRAVPGGQPLKLSTKQAKLLAEAEHGRWNIERLRAGWQIGQRQVARRVSPHLKPWDELDEGTQKYDIEAVENIAPALAAQGWGVVDL